MVDRPSRKNGGDSQGEVTVALKMPAGLILSTFIMREINEATPVGFRQVQKAFPSGRQQVRLNGYATPVGMSPKCEVINGFAITKGVPADIWEQWLKDNIDSIMVERGIIYGDPDMDNVKRHCLEHDKLENGLQPINPKGDIRMPGKIKAVSAMETAQIPGT